MRALLTDASPRAQVRAIVTYHFNIEGIGAESAYPIYYEVFNKTGLFPAMREGITLIRRDEARHIAFGTYLLNRLINETRRGRRRVRGRARGARAVHRRGRQPDLRPFDGKPAPFGLDQAKFSALYRENFGLMKRAVYERQLPAAV